MKSWRAIALAAVAAGVAPAASARALGVLECGGIGADEREALAADVGRSNLELEFFVANSGAYVADVDVTLTPAKGGERALTVTSEGPLCYLQVPPGQYRIDARFNGATESARAAVPANAREPVHVAVAFPSQVAGDTGPAPSPEERQQARTP